MAYDYIIQAPYAIQQRLFLKSVKCNEVPLVFWSTSLARSSCQVSDETVLQVLLTAWDKIKNDRLADLWVCLKPRSSCWFDRPGSVFYSAGLERFGGLEVHKRIELILSENTAKLSPRAIGYRILTFLKIAQHHQTATENPYANTIR